VLLAGCASTPAADTHSGTKAGAGDGPASETRAPHDQDPFSGRIAPVLVAASVNPYAPPEPLDCPTLAARVQELDAVLGPDLDDPRRAARHAFSAAGLLISGLQSAIPYYGWLRRLTGADRREQLAEDTFAAGMARRGYLKGLGERLACTPPAAPLRRPRDGEGPSNPP
jgi:hypothetical protein